jgi:hypothetical protein
MWDITKWIKKDNKLKSLVHPLLYLMDLFGDLDATLEYLDKRTKLLY